MSHCTWRTCAVDRETFLQALRCCIVGAGAKMSAAVSADVSAQLQALLSCGEDVTRMAAAACLGCLVQHLDNDERVSIMNAHLLGQSLRSQSFLTKNV